MGPSSVCVEKPIRSAGIGGVITLKLIGGREARCTSQRSGGGWSSHRGVGPEFFPHLDFFVKADSRGPSQFPLRKLLESLQCHFLRP